MKSFWERNASTILQIVDLIAVSVNEPLKPGQLAKIFKCNS